MLDLELLLNIIWACYFIGPATSCPCGTFYVCKIITYGRNAAQTKSGEREPEPGETFCNSAYLYWSQFKKAILLPILLWCLAFGESMLLAFGNNFGLFVFVANLWRIGEDVKTCLLGLVTIQNGLYCWHIVTMAGIAEYSVPVDSVLLDKILVENEVINLLIIFTALALLTTGVIIGKNDLDKTKYSTSIFGSTGAGICLALVSDAPALFSNSKKAKIGHLYTNIILGVIWLWAAVLMIMYISIVEATPHPILIGLWQPAVFGFTSFILSWKLYGVYDGKTIYELKSAFIVLVASMITVMYDSYGEDYHSLKTSNGKPSKFYFLGDDFWSSVTNLRLVFFSDPDQQPTAHPQTLANVQIVGAIGGELELSIYGNVLGSPKSEHDESASCFEAEGSIDIGREISVL